MILGSSRLRVASAKEAMSVVLVDRGSLGDCSILQLAVKTDTRKKPASPLYFLSNPFA